MNRQDGRWIPDIGDPLKVVVLKEYSEALPNDCWTGSIRFILDCPDESRLDVLNINKSIIVDKGILQPVLVEIHLEIDKRESLPVLILHRVVLKDEPGVHGLRAGERKMLISQRGLRVCPRDIDESIVRHRHIDRILGIEHGAVATLIQPCEQAVFHDKIIRNSCLLVEWTLGHGLDNKYSGNNWQIYKRALKS